MKELFILYGKMISIIFQLVINSFRKKVILIGYPTHSNLGDQAQLMCTYKWIKENYSDCKVIAIPCHTYFEGITPYPIIIIWSIAFALIFGTLKLTIHKNDIFIGHSGYYLVDHHGGWYKFVRIAKIFPKNPFTIFPQTFNMYNPFFTKTLVSAFDKHENLTLLCRDEVSYNRAKTLFKHINLLLYPDIVTSLIGTEQYDFNRDGVLFCMRNDVEAFYSKEAITDFRSRFSCKTELTDTTIFVSEREMAKRREELIYQKIKEFSHYRLIITDRYHGTIFSQIAATPVIVISSADHKLSSGVKWFPKDLFDKHIYYAKDLEEAYLIAQQLLSDRDIKYTTPQYFKENYWDKLAGLIK